jgi:S-adenosylmethionine decarboxylase
MVPLAYSLAQSNLSPIRCGCSNFEAATFSLRLPADLQTIDMTLGTEWVIDAAGCDASALTDVERIRAVFSRVIRDLDLHVLGEISWHQFSPPGGLSGLALLSESHLACHTYPEFRAATFNLYCCRNRGTWPWEEMLVEMLGATSVSVRMFKRLIGEDEPMVEAVSKSAT